MNIVSEIESIINQLDTDGLQLLLQRIQQQLVTRIDQWFEKHEVGDEHSDGTSNLLVVEIDGTPEDPYIDVDNGLVVYELTREGPFQADVTEEFIADEEAADYSKFKVTHLLAMLQRLEKEAATY
jgi:hypothetical protein